MTSSPGDDVIGRAERLRQALLDDAQREPHERFFQVISAAFKTTTTILTNASISR